jgi:hypothetical protein
LMSNECSLWADSSCPMSTAGWVCSPLAHLCV